jgi:hypothetical protein
MHDRRSPPFLKGLRNEDNVSRPVSEPSGASPVPHRFSILGRLGPVRQRLTNDPLGVLCLFNNLTPTELRIARAHSMYSRGVQDPYSRTASTAQSLKSSPLLNNSKGVGFSLRPLDLFRLAYAGQHPVKWLTSRARAHFCQVIRQRPPNRPAEALICVLYGRVAF